MEGGGTGPAPKATALLCEARPGVPAVNALVRERYCTEAQRQKHRLFLGLKPTASEEVNDPGGAPQPLGGLDP